MLNFVPKFSAYRAVRSQSVSDGVHIFVVACSHICLPYLFPLFDRRAMIDHTLSIICFFLSDQIVRRHDSKQPLRCSHLRTLVVLLRYRAGNSRDKKSLAQFSLSNRDAFIDSGFFTQTNAFIEVKQNAFAVLCAVFS